MTLLHAIKGNGSMRVKRIRKGWYGLFDTAGRQLAGGDAGFIMDQFARRKK